MKVETYKFRHKIFDFMTNFQRKFVITHCNEWLVEALSSVSTNNNHYNE